jgi:hypothetical protein
MTSSRAIEINVPNFSRYRLTDTQILAALEPLRSVVGGIHSAHVQVGCSHADVGLYSGAGVLWCISGAAEKGSYQPQFLLLVTNIPSKQETSRQSFSI